MGMRAKKEDWVMTDLHVLQTAPALTMERRGRQERMSSIKLKPKQLQSSDVVANRETRLCSATESPKSRTYVAFLSSHDTEAADFSSISDNGAASSATRTPGSSESVLCPFLPFLVVFFLRTPGRTSNPNR
ncbi:hypothetical protein MRB53_006916 [Persea americana]|uniref:Uncharacterized protein n=1 Tax=Persea americana TaxID=3435 RepID=A0ACC2MI07_PERAE|nr:hypothetical protein MRB53_006916 [Persea americana]